MIYTILSVTTMNEIPLENDECLITIYAEDGPFSFEQMCFNRVFEVQATQILIKPKNFQVFFMRFKKLDFFSLNLNKFPSFFVVILT